MGGESVGGCRLGRGLCLPHAPSPARPPPSTSPSSQWWAPSWRGPRRWGHRRRSRSSSRRRCATGSAAWRTGCAPRGRRAPRASSPCLVQARTDRQRLGGRVLVVRLGRGDALLVERRSDGSAAVSFTDGASAGATVGVGLRVPSGPRIGARGGAGVQFSAGRTWEFASFAAAARFVRRWAPRESLGGEARRLLRRACPLCRRPRVAADAEARRDLPRGRGLRRVRRGAAPRGPRVGVGRRRGGRGRADHGPPRRPRRARHLVRPRRRRDRRPPRAPCSAPSRRAAPAMRRSRSRSSTAGPSSCGCAPRRAGTATSTCRARPPRSATSPRPCAARPPRRREGAGAASRPRSRSTSPTPPTGARSPAWSTCCACGCDRRDWDDRLRALAARLDADGAVDVRLLRVGLEERDAGAEAALGLVVGGNYRRTQEVRDLVRAWSLRAGGGAAGAGGLCQRVTNGRAERSS